MAREVGDAGAALPNDDELLDGVEDLDDGYFTNYREKRVAEMKLAQQRREDMARADHGTLTELAEKDFLGVVTKTKLVVAHFYHPEFRRCLIMDARLQEVARKHFKTKFVKLNVTTTGFFVEKLQVRTLPCVIVFIDGVAVDRVVGFEELGGSDGFSTLVLEQRLAKSGVIEFKEAQGMQRVGKRTLYGGSTAAGGDEEDDADDLLD